MPLLRNSPGSGTSADKLHNEMQIEPESRGCKMPTFGITKGTKVGDISHGNGQQGVTKFLDNKGDKISDANQVEG